MAYPAIAWPVTITAGSNDAIDIKEDGGAEQNLTLTAGSYQPLGSDTTAGTLAKAIKDTLGGAAGNGTYTVTISVTGLITIAVSGAVSAVQLLFGTGTNRATSCRYVTGFGAADTSSAASVSGTAQLHGVFLCMSGGPDLADDTEDRANIQTSQHIAADGTVIERPFGSHRYTRDIQIAMVPRARMFKTTNLQQSIEDLYEYVRGGNSRYVRFYSDVTVPATYTSYHLAPSDGEQDSLAGWRRHSPGVELWGGQLTMRKHV
jgi:hypothetical protein